MKITQDYYLIIDLEATCADDKSIRGRDMEIIEIGAVLLNAKTLEIESDYQTFIQPVIHTQLTDFCTSLTSITQQQVDQAPIFPDALKAFQAWFEPYGSYLFCSWGNYDKNQFELDCDRYNIDYPFPGGHLNIKKEFSAFFETTKKFGMAGALRKLGLELEGVHHRGIDDARNIARIVQTLMSQS